MICSCLPEAGLIMSIKRGIEAHKQPVCAVALIFFAIISLNYILFNKIDVILLDLSPPQQPKAAANTARQQRKLKRASPPPLRTLGNFTTQLPPHTLLSTQPYRLLAAALMLACTKGVQWTWHYTPYGHHPSPSVTLS
jgi:hypothetical protein